MGLYERNQEMGIAVHFGHQILEMEWKLKLYL